MDSVACFTRLLQQHNRRISLFRNRWKHVYYSAFVYDLLPQALICAGDPPLFAKKCRKDTLGLFQYYLWSNFRNFWMSRVKNSMVNYWHRTIFKVGNSSREIIKNSSGETWKITKIPGLKRKVTRYSLRQLHELIIILKTFKLLWLAKNQKSRIEKIKAPAGIKSKAQSTRDF